MSPRDPTAPLVTVIVPVHNGEKYLGEALRSVLAQDFGPTEILVVDDGSEDQSATIAASFAGVRCFHQPRQGVSASRNVGIRRARGNLLAFLDSDDVWAPDKLAAQVAYLSEHPETGYVLCRMRNILEPGTTPPPWLRPGDLSGEVNAYIPSALMVRKEVFDRVGVFDTTYLSGEDTEWFSRATHHGIGMTILPHVLVHRRIHSSNVSSLALERRAGQLLRIVKASIDRKKGLPGDGAT